MPRQDKLSAVIEESERMIGMDIENHTTRQVYIQLLTDVLKKKLEVLNRLMSLTEQQEKMIASDLFEGDQFLQTITLKEEQIQNLSKLDTGFEQLYEGVKKELNLNKENYVAEITLLKEDILSITDMSVKLQAMEKRNKLKLESIFAKKRKDIKNSKISSQTATNYYKTMANRHEVQSYFYDKKK